MGLEGNNGTAEARWVMGGGRTEPRSSTDTEEVSNMAHVGEETRAFLPMASSVSSFCYAYVDNQWLLPQGSL